MESLVVLGVLWWILVHFFTGLVARAVTPGDQSMGFIKTTLLGAVGSWVGGFVARSCLHRSEPVGFVGSVLGAVLLLVLFSLSDND